MPHYVDASRVVEDLSSVVDTLDPVATRDARIEAAMDEFVAMGIMARIEMADDGVTIVHIGEASAETLGFIRGTLDARFGILVRVVELNKG